MKPVRSVKPKSINLDHATKAWLTTVNELGRLPRGSTQNALKGLDRAKAIFTANKKSVFDLWEVYTQQRDELSRKLINNKEFSISYLLGFHLANAARANDLFIRSNKRHFWNKLCAAHPTRVYDIGCGTGAMSIAYLQNAKASEIFLFDSSGPLLDVAKKIHSHANDKAVVKTTRRAIEDLEPQWFTSADSNTNHVYLLGYVWNELHRNNPAKRRLMEIFSNHLTKNERFFVFIAEPATEHQSRHTMELRNILCGMGLIALYPCPHSHACPMLERPKDWCYSEGTWQQPAIAQWIDRGLRIDRCKHASTVFAFASPATRLQSDPSTIVVGRPVREDTKERSKGFFDYLLCGPTGLTKEAPAKPKTLELRGTVFTNNATT